MHLQCEEKIIQVVHPDKVSTPYTHILPDILPVEPMFSKRRDRVQPSSTSSQAQKQRLKGNEYGKSLVFSSTDSVETLAVKKKTSGIGCNEVQTVVFIFII